MGWFFEVLFSPGWRPVRSLEPLVQERPQIVIPGIGSDEGDFFAVSRVLEFGAAAMEHYPPGGRASAGAVFQISLDRPAHGRELGADLVVSACQGPGFHEEVPIGSHQQTIGEFGFHRIPLFSG
jgi:hypothetical protein